MDQELIEHAADFEEAFRTLLREDALGRLAAVGLPIGSRDFAQSVELTIRHVARHVGKGPVLRVQSFEREQGAPQVAARDAGEERGDVGRQGEVLAFGDVIDDLADLGASSDAGPVFARHVRTSSSVGAPTRSRRQRLRIGPMILLVELAHKMRRMLVVYSSKSLERADTESRSERTFHGPPQRRLRITRELIRLVDDDHCVVSALRSPSHGKTHP